MLFAKSEQKETLNSCLLSRMEECPQGGGGGEGGNAVLLKMIVLQKFFN